MSSDFTSTARRLGIYSAIVVILLLITYAITLIVGLASLQSPQQRIADPMFSILEVLIVVMMPAMVTLMVAVHAWAPVRAKTLSFAAVIFMALLAGLTCTLHFVILTVSHQPAFAGASSLQRLLSFEWPSVAYSIDILGWDIFFALSMFCAAPVFSGTRLTAWIRSLMIVSGVLSLAGLSGVVSGDMRLRNIGIIGYVPVFLVVTTLLAILFNRTNVPVDSNGQAITEQNRSTPFRQEPIA
jgi:hypothetical protein